MKVLVTGATGFFGKAIVDRLRRAGHDVIGAARHADEKIEHLDICSTQSCRQLLSRYPNLDAVVHCAAIAHADDGAFSAEQYRLTNAEGARNLIDAAIASGAKRFIQISTVSVYGEFDLPNPVHETSPMHPLGDYGVCKKAAEDFCLQRKNEIRLSILRMATMYGDDWLFNIRRKVTPPKIGKYCYLTLDGRSRRYSLCSNINGAEAVLWSIEDRLDAGIYNVADCHRYSLQDVLKAVKKLEGSKLHVAVPGTIASIILRALIVLARNAEAKRNAYNRYWKFYRHNLYATDKLQAAGFDACPHLLRMTE